MISNMNIEFDYYGNLYIITDKSYQVNIDPDDNLYLEEGSYDILEDIHDLKYKKLDTVTTSLKNEVIKDIEKNQDNEAYMEFIKFYPEEVDYIEYYEELNKEDNSDHELYDYDNYKRYGEYNKPFQFSGIDNYKYPVRNRLNGDIAAIYDTYVYDENDNFIFKSNSYYGDSTYRICIYKDYITVRQLGENHITYKFDGDKLVKIF